MRTSSFKPAFGLAAIALLFLALAVACGDNGAQPTSTATVGPATPTPLATPTPSVASPSPIASPIVVGGITVHPFDAWFQQGRSSCAFIRLGTDSPYRAPELYSIRDEELPDLGLPISERSRAGVCKSAGITAIAYTSEDAWVILADGPHEWPVYEPGAQVSEGTVAGRPAVLLTDPQSWSFTAMVIVAEEFGLTVVALRGTVDEAKQIAGAIDREHVRIPQGKDTFSGTLNEIRFYDYGHGENRRDGCLWGGYGLEGSRTPTVDIPPDTPLDVLPSYLPEGYSLFEKTGTSCGGTIDLVQAYFSREPGGDGFSVRRFSGEPAWFSPYSEDWLTPGTIAGHSAVFIAPPAWASYMTYMQIEVVVKEDFGLTVVTGQISLEEAKRIAEGLNR
jgi:hypothetical protein